MVPRPPRIAPMLLATGAPPRGPLSVEPKWDGARSTASIHEGRLTLHSRRGFDVTDCYPELHALPPVLAGRACVLDGEIVAFDETGRCDFQRLQQRMNRRRPSPVTCARIPVVFVAFDVLWLDGEDLTSRPLSERRRVLEMFGLSGHWQLTMRFGDRVDADLRDACEAIGIEGLVIKREAGVYRPGMRCNDWVKLKFRRTMLAVIGGELQQKSRYGSLAVGAHHEGAFRYVGQVGNSLPHADSAALEKFLTTIEQQSSPFVDLVRAPMTYVEPYVVVEITYTEITAASRR